MKIHRTEIMCFPRSWHHYLIDLLTEYYGAALRYCEYYSHPAGALNVCEETHLQKNHDFDLATEKKQDRKYLIQVRDPLEAINSHFELEPHYAYPTDPYEVFFKKRITHYAAFVEKWVLAKDLPHKMVLHYSDLTAFPVQSVFKVLQFISDDFPDLKAIQRAVKKHPSRAKPGFRRNVVPF